MSNFVERRLVPRISPGIAITACLLSMVVGIGAWVLYFARAQDAEEILSERKIVTSAITDAMAKLGDALRPNTYWDDGYNHMTDTVESGWAEKNLGPYARETSGVSVVLVVSGARKTVYRFTGDEPHKSPTDFERNAAVKSLIAQALAKTSAPPAIANGFVRIGTRIYLAAASQIVPNDDRAKTELARHNVEVYLQRFGAARISKVERDFQLSRASLSLTPPPAHMASLTLRDAAGRQIGFLWWQPGAPGKTFALAVAPFALGMVALIGLLLWLALRNWAFTLLHLERQKAETESLRQEARAKSVFIGNISHELRTPLNAILGFSDIFTKQSYGPLGSENYREYAGYIHASGKSLLAIINDIIELSSIEAREKQFSVQPVAACLLIGEAVDAVGARAAAKNITIDVARGDPGLAVCSSVPAMHEILVRLLDNAIKFSHDGHRVEVGAECGDGTVVLRVRDHGIGIPPHVIPVLGKPFAQVEGLLTRSHGGLGLGLAICFGLAKALNIAIAIDSSIDHGTTVTLRLPGAAELSAAA